MRWRAMLMALGLVGCSDGGWFAPDPPKTGTSVALSVRLPLGDLRESGDNHGVETETPQAALLPGMVAQRGASSDERTEPIEQGAPQSAALEPKNGPGSPDEPTAELRPPAETRLLALGRETFVFRQPDVGSRRLGYLRAGALIQGSATQVSGRGCPQGFTEIEPYGYVCSSDVSSDPDIELAAALARRPNRRAEMPFWYGESRSPTPPLYNRVPTLEEQRRTEPELARSRSRDGWRDFPLGEVPEFLRGGQASFRFDGKRRSLLAVSLGRAKTDSAFAFLELFEVDGRAFGLSTDLSILPLDHLEPVVVSRFSGVALGRSHELPLGFVRARNAHLYVGGAGKGLRRTRQIDFREAFALSGERLRVAGKTYLQTRTGEWLEETRQVVLVEPLSSEPHWAKPGKTWIDVDLSAQTLVAYEGVRPVYATLVSTGADVGGQRTAPPRTARADTVPSLDSAASQLDAGVAASEEPEIDSRRTIEGQFRVHTKHVTATMDSDTPGDEFDLRDVPYVQYFSGNYALHAAFWHDAFGVPKSHGCINLSPLDARWLFEWTRPRVPSNWHGAMSLLSGTLINVHQ